MSEQDWTRVFAALLWLGLTIYILYDAIILRPRRQGRAKRG
jgi:hypothetical protein